MKVWVVIKTNGIYNDDVTVVAVAASKARAEKAAREDRDAMYTECHDGVECNGDDDDCEACGEYETGGHYVNVEEWEVA
jgi:hypothetical protein